MAFAIVAQLTSLTEQLAATREDLVLTASTFREVNDAATAGIKALGAQVTTTQEQAKEGASVVMGAMAEAKTAADETFQQIGASTEQAKEMVRGMAGEAKSAADETRRHVETSRDHVDDALEKLKEWKTSGDATKEFAAELAQQVAAGLLTQQAYERTMKEFGASGRKIIEELDPGALQQGLQKFLADLQAGKLSSDEILSGLEERFDGIGGIFDTLREALENADGSSADMLERLRAGLAEFAKQVGDPAGGADVIRSLLNQTLR